MIICENCGSEMVRKEEVFFVVGDRLTVGNYSECVSCKATTNLTLLHRRI